MNDIQLTTLLRRFMDGMTTVDEESALAGFFRRATDADRPDGVSADDWKVYRQMFAMFEDNGAGLADDGGRLSAPRRTRVRLWVGRVAAAAAAVVLLAVGGFTLLPRDGGGANGGVRQTLARHDDNSALAVDSFADSVSAEQPRRIVPDSLKNGERQSPSRKRVRPYWQPRPPKVYVAGVVDEAGGKSGAEPDSRQIDEAVRQTEVLLKAIGLQQAAELRQLELQAMENVADAGDGSDDDDTAQ